MQQEIRFVEDYHMPDHVHMLVQNFWVVVDVVFTVGEVEKSISAALESGMSGSIFIQYPMTKNGKSRIIFKRMGLRTYVVPFRY